MRPVGLYQGGGMELEKRIETVREGLRGGRFTSEAAVSQGAVLPILETLGWPVFDTTVVIPEFSVEARKVDFALCHPARRPAVFIEVKRVGLTDGGDRQLFEYAFHEGVPMAILTDGQEWSFYLPGEQGHYSDRRVYKLDLLEREADESSRRLDRYLSYDRVCSGEALTDARLDYRNVARRREARASIPAAWAALIEEHDSLLLELLADKVEDICGYKPELDECGAFLERMSESRSAIHSERISKDRTTLEQRRPEILKRNGREQFEFSLGGQQHFARSARDVMVQVFTLLAEQDPQFLERFAARKHGKKRRYLAQDRAELYPGRPDLAEAHAVKIVPGWWMGTNYSRRDMQKILALAREVADPEISATLRANVLDAEG